MINFKEEIEKVIENEKNLGNHLEYIVIDGLEVDCFNPYSNGSSFFI